MKITLKNAAEIIKNGELVAFPTETVYGLGADAWNTNAVKKTFQTKGRPADNPLIVHISRLEQVQALAIDIPHDFYSLADAFWPGPLTMVLKKHHTIPDIVTGRLTTVAIRMPDHPLAIALIDQTGPLTAPSANPSGKPSPTRAEHVDYDYNGEIPVLDGGATEIGLESTVLDLSTGQPEILRPGAVTRGMIEKIIKKNVHETGDTDFKSTKSPGTRYTHYKPAASVHWLEKLPVQYDTLAYYIIHSKSAPEESRNVHSYPGDLEGIARDLYDHFRTADHLNFPQIFVETLSPAVKTPIAKALLNRVDKAVGK